MSNDGGGFRWFSGIIATIISGVVVYYLTEGRNPQPPQSNSEPSGISQGTPPSPPTKPTSPVTRTPRPTPQPSPSSEIALVSSRGINYTKLRDLLAQGKWKEADQETTDLLLRISNRKQEGWLRAEDVKNLSCEDLRTMDKLWVAYSQGKFGFSVQREIYQSLGGTSEYNADIWRKFGDRVGWRVNSNWLHYKDVTFDQKALEGHLPTSVVAARNYSVVAARIEGSDVLFWGLGGVTFILSVACGL